jgi:flagellar hook-length control protein FliK
MRPDAPFPEAAMPRAALPQLPAAILAQMAQAVKGGALAVMGREEIFVQMEPAHLGRVQVAMEMHQGRVAARIAVESESVRQLLDNQLPALRQSLEQQGVRLESLEVSVQDRQASLLNPDGQNADSFFQRRRGGGQEEMDGTVPGTEGRAESDTGRRWGFNTVEYIA